MRRVGASAPGKALLCGEYAVLEGAPAVVAAVDRRVFISWSESAAPMPAEVAATLQRAQAEVGSVEGALTVDVRDLQHERIKLGLGSSAAAAAATAAAVFASRGHELEDPATLQRVFKCAFEGHRSIAAEGSGVDVAASAFGGFLRFARSGNEIEIRPVVMPIGLSMRLIWTGHAARTSDLVSKVQSLSRHDPGLHQQCMDRLTDLSEQFASAFEAGSAGKLVSIAAAYSTAMGALGEAASAPILAASLLRVTELAAQFSGSAKPCGAGGGDVAIAFFVDSDAASGFELACKEEGLHPVDVSWGAAGIRAC